MDKLKSQKVALITEELGKGWIVSADALPYIDARGRGYRTARAAIASAREDGYTHYRGANNADHKKIHKL